jgi:hypothetical protein
MTIVKRSGEFQVLGKANWCGARLDAALYPIRLEKTGSWRE